MATLSSSIVKHHVASMREVEEALARQVIYGGDLVTNLLELAAVSEAQLTWLLADSLGLEAAPIGELPRAADSVLALVPSDLARRHAIYPLEENGGALTLAVSDTLSPDVVDNLAFSLGVSVTQRAAPLVRIQQALSRDYGSALDRRMLRLVAKLEGRPDPSPSSMPAPLRDAAGGFPKLPRPASIPPIDYSGIPAESATKPAEPEPAAVRSTAATLITPRHPAEPKPKPPPPGWLQATAPRERGRRRHRGPYTAAEAEKDLLDAESRDDVVVAFFDFASQYFEYSALFVLQGDIAEGREAHGPGADREGIRGIGFPLDLPSALSRAKTTRTFQLLRLANDGLDANLAADLGRKPGRVALVLPIVVRGRCVLLLYGDQGEADVVLDEVGDVIAFAPLIASSIERVILKKKLAARREVEGVEGTPKPIADLQRRRRHKLPAIEQRVHALARAFDAGSSSTRSSRPPARMESAPPPATVAASPGALGGPSTAHESPAAKAGPTTAGESPQAIKGPTTAGESPQALRGPTTAGESPHAPGAPSAPAASPQAAAPTSPTASPQTLDSAEVQAIEQAPAAPTTAVTSELPATPHETPAARAQAAAPERRHTPPHGTPRALTPPALDKPAAAQSEAEATKTTPETTTALSLGAAAREATQARAEAPGETQQEDQPFPLTRRTPNRSPSAGPSSGEMLAQVDEGWDRRTDPGLARAALEKEEKSDVGHEAPLAPSSRQLALGPRAPFRRQDASDRLLPSVIVDVNADSQLLVERLVEGDTDALEAVVRAGDAAVSQLVARFPGALHPDRKRTFADPGARASDCGLVLKALSLIGAVAIPFVVVRTADRDPLVRAWATWLLGELPSPESARAVVRRFSDADPDVRRAALAAGRMQQADISARTALRDALATTAADPSQSPQARHDAIQALADLRDGRAVPRLLLLLDDDSAAIQKSAHWALCALSRQDHGLDVVAWADWWEGKGTHHRIEWLIDALTHERVDIRRAAGEELKSLTKEYFGYYEDLSAPERERAQQAYRDWWQRVGKSRFS